MNYSMLPIIFSALFLLGGCAFFGTAQTPPEPLELPVTKNWQIREEPPVLSNESDRLSFQSEQSVQPDGAKPVPPADNRTIKTPL